MSNPKAFVVTILVWNKSRSLKLHRQARWLTTDWLVTRGDYLKASKTFVLGNREGIPPSYSPCLETPPNTVIEEHDLSYLLLDTTSQNTEFQKMNTFRPWTNTLSLPKKRPAISSWPLRFLEGRKLKTLLGCRRGIGDPGNRHCKQHFRSQKWYVAARW